MYFKILILFIACMKFLILPFSGKQSGGAQQGSQQRNGEHRVKFSEREERNNRRNKSDGPSNGQMQRYAFRM